MNRMDDLISRAEAIELKPEFLNPNVNRETKEQTAIDRAYARGWNSCNTHWIKEIVEDLPSVQPEKVCIAKITLSEEQVREAVEKAKSETVQVFSSTQPEQRWISCSERLPENNDPVNVTWVNHNPEVYYADIKDKPFTATAHYHNGRWYWFSSVTQDYLNEYDVWTPDLVDKDVEITAWMPLLEPYKRGQNE